MNGKHIIAGTFLSLVVSASAFADVTPEQLDKRGDRIEQRLDNKGDRIEKRLDNKGDRIENRMDAKADKARAAGKEEKAERLERKLRSDLEKGELLFSKKATLKNFLSEWMEIVRSPVLYRRQRYPIIISNLPAPWNSKQNKQKYNNCFNSHNISVKSFIRVNYL